MTRRNCWSKWKPSVRLLSIVIATIMFLMEVMLVAFEYIRFRIEENVISAVFSGMFLIHSLFTLMYVIGAIKAIECFMVPWLTLQLIFLTSFSLFVIVWWIATLLSVFGLVTYYAPAQQDGLTVPEYFVIIGVILTIVLIVCIKISHILYRGFVKVRNQNLLDYRIDMALSSKVQLPLKPSYV